MATDHKSPNEPSLVVKLPYTYCNNCTDMLRKWCEPTERFNDDSFALYDYRFCLSRRGPKSFERDARDEHIPLWMIFMGDLKERSAKCRCCRFLLEVLRASPWTGPTDYNDDDFVVVKSRLVGSRHIEVQYDGYDRQLDYRYRHGSSLPSSRYERYYRPVLQLYRKVDLKQGDEDERGYNTHQPREPTFILPLARPPGTHSDCNHDNTFHGRRVLETVDMALLQSWFRTCVAEHYDCVPTPLPQIPYFRLVDVQKRCVVLAEQRPVPERSRASLESNGRLVEDEYQYAALSYVWGQAKRLLLIEQNVDKLSTPGALSSDNDEIPQTFKDALNVASKLGIPYLWIDALCVQQDNETHLVQHMNAMDSIYSSAVLTIVSDGESADSGLPGLGSTPRSPPQAAFNFGNQAYISAKRTFGAALVTSQWESRAWCLQEKLFSKRLLVFTSCQVFYHCNSTTWFEDTVMENSTPKDKSQSRVKSSKITIAERASPSRKAKRSQGHTAYEAHAKLFGRNFWSLIETYTQRQLSFESDAIRAFSGILKSLESENGPSHWGVPENHFARGITWSAHPHRMTCRRPDGLFPTWSWASWRGNDSTPQTTSRIHFGNVLEHVADIWKLDFYIYKPHWLTGKYTLSPIGQCLQQRKLRAISGGQNKPTNRTPTGDATLQSAATKSPKIQSTTVETDPPPQPIDPYQFFSAWTDMTTGPAGNWQEQHEWSKGRQNIRGWDIPGHPGEKDYVPNSGTTFPPFQHDPSTMPPLSHIIQFYTSVATVQIDQEPGMDSEGHWNPGTMNGMEDSSYYTIRSTTQKKHWLAQVQLDKTWREEVHKDKTEFEMVYISLGFFPPCDNPLEGFGASEILWAMLVEDYPTGTICTKATTSSSVESKEEGKSESMWGEPISDSDTGTEAGVHVGVGNTNSTETQLRLRRRVQLVGPIDIIHWRLAEPRWECVALA